MLRVAAEHEEGDLKQKRRATKQSKTKQNQKAITTIIFGIPYSAWIFQKA